MKRSIPIVFPPKEKADERKLFFYLNLIDKLLIGINLEDEFTLSIRSKCMWWMINMKEFFWQTRKRRKNCKYKKRANIQMTECE